MLDVDGVAAKTTAEEITLAGGHALSFQCDVADPASVSGVFSLIAAQGPIDLLINSAGIAHVGTITTTNIEDFERVLRVNVEGAYLCM